MFLSLALYCLSNVADANIVESTVQKVSQKRVWSLMRIFMKTILAVKDKGTTLTKSMLASKNLPKPITNASEGYHWIRVLAAELALRLNDARQISPNLWPKTIVLHARKGQYPFVIPLCGLS